MRSHVDAYQKKIPALGDHDLNHRSSIMTRFRSALLAVASVAGLVGAVAASEPAQARTFVSVGVGLPVVAPVYPVPAYAPVVPYPGYVAAYPYAPYPAYYGPTVVVGHGWGWHHWHR
jgi:hypothetical protein